MGMVLGKIDVETPAHKVLRKTSLYEIREYPPAVMAAVYSDEMDNMRDDRFMNAGFRVLAGYIGVWKNGDNISKQQIAMTAPVIQKNEAKGTGQQIAMTAPVLEKTEGDRQMMAFLLPKEFTLANAPEPIDKRVHLEEVEPRVMAVHTFSGAVAIDGFKSLAHKVMDQLEKDGLKYHGRDQYEVAYYNPPFTLPFLRTNEVFVPLVAGQDFGAPAQTTA